MPELPEVETVVRDLRPHLVGSRIASLRVSRHRLRQRWLPAWNQLLLGRQVKEIRRRGKWICALLDDDRYLVFHLGMSGQLTIVARELPVQKHTHVIFDLDDGVSQLRFRDIRRFGLVVVVEDQAALEALLDPGKLGPEPFDLKPAYWRRRLTATRRCLKAALLDQRLVAGVGNIYADESLFEAGLPPTQRGSQTSADEADRLRRSIVRVLNRAIARRGSSIQSYVGGEGLQGEYQNEFRAYGRTGEPCPRCDTPIERIRLAGRSTHFCPRCQKKAVRGR
ncbi:MAG: bifunctional DNA-formamidopyrimidine glycosylase/DNA-(apurinic or apyrimidinic site) lyase [Planctomycetia bacterium]|nr:bifunctional DNA-formamidopyrimidine glycosylase/DNA-(apurinic or apyrimidinic site) lyase [Planctomycetia bacterium]